MQPEFLGEKLSALLTMTQVCPSDLVRQGTKRLQPGFNSKCVWPSQLTYPLNRFHVWKKPHVQRAQPGTGRKSAPSDVSDHSV